LRRCAHADALVVKWEDTFMIAQASPTSALL
jgi:hypothetical protein